MLGTSFKHKIQLHKPISSRATMTSFQSILAILTVVLAHLASAESIRNEFDLPVDKEWMSLTKSVDYMPAANNENSSVLRKAQSRLLNYYKDEFVDSLETQYDENAQAWRYLGLYVDCNVYADNKRRALDEVEDEEEDVEDEAEAEEEEPDEEEEVADDGKVCKRYLLWAAYADLDYQGNGISEYMIYNTKNKSWDKTACNSSNSKRCVKMDCHNQGTNFKPLGYFRQDAPVEFLALLATYQGSCSFNDGEANAVADGAEWLPQQCTQSQLEDGTVIYFDLQPKNSGAVDIALYTDSKCSMLYSGSTTAQTVLTTYYGYDVSLEENMKNINSALDTFKVCTPCRTFDLTNTPEAAAAAAAAEAEGEDGAAEEAEYVNTAFVCNDDAGNAGVNQCAMFAQNSDVSSATMSEIGTASRQGSITRLYASAEGRESWWQGWGFFFMSCLTFLVGMICFCSIAVKRKRITSNNKNEPLLARQ